MSTIQDILGKEVLFFDGGTGSLLQAQGLAPGELPELWNITHQEEIVALHYNYFCAGANIIKTNTFGANSLKFPSTVQQASRSEASDSDVIQTGCGCGCHAPDKAVTPSHQPECTDYSLEQIVAAALANANEARRRIEAAHFTEQQLSDLRERHRAPAHSNPAGRHHFIALDIGPAGKLLEPLGDLSFDGAVELFAQVIRAGIASGVAATSPDLATGSGSQKLPFDLVLIETMNDCYEAKAAVIAAKEVMEETDTSFPVFVTTVYDESAKSLTGSDPQTMVTILEGLGVSGLGMNCSLGPVQMEPIVTMLASESSTPLIVNPNAGLPRSEDGRTVYDISPEQFAQIVSGFVDRGVALVGGCCGTTPEHICRLVDACHGKSCPAATDRGISRISSYTRTVELGGKPVLVGERINPTGKKRFKQALKENDLPYIINEGLAQEDRGVHVLDVNVGLPEIDEVAMLRSVVKELQSVTELPLQLDTSDPIAMEQAMRLYNGKPLINSVNGKAEVMEEIFPLVKKYGGVVVALTLDEEGIPETAEGRIKIVEKIYATAAKYGIGRKDIIIDPLAMAISSDTTAAAATLDTLHAVKTRFGGTTILGVSNISFGLPQRELITAAFFTMAMERGLSAAIMNPNATEMMKAYTCFCTLRGFDPNCTGYIDFALQYQQEAEAAKAALAQGAGSTTPGATPAAEKTTAGGDCIIAPDGTPLQKGTLQYAVVRGLKPEAHQYTAALLDTIQPLDIINQHLIPALDIVGKGFETKKLFLPQLLMSAEAAKEAFSVIKKQMIRTGTKGESKGTVVLATVKGDIHDIGKNIVKVLMENYSFTVIDLGRDVPPEKVLETVQEHDIRLVGLSALMTTTVPSMEATIKLLREKAPGCTVCVGGAVMTREYADMIGADFYGKDALETVRFAQEFFDG
ncbi:MAG: homocysteine S-methyltransferase family protein [Spirochaetaceae bacterium]|nr:homocysteine S-methyltransferase family protein [Spirochaetaceae bacterium]